jgi:hypothetical protein
MYEIGIRIIYVCRYGIISTWWIRARGRVGGEIDSRYRGLRPVLAPLHKMVYRIDYVTVGSGRAGGREKPEAGTH